MSIQIPTQTRLLLARRCIGRRKHNGVILLIVLVVVAAFSVAAYAMSHQMLTELEVVKATNQSTRQRLLAESAIQRLLSSEPAELATLTYSPARDNANSDVEIHVGTAVQAVNSSRDLGYSAILRAIPVPGGPVRYGLNNQSAKLNLNSLTADRYSRRQVIEKLMHYPDLSEAIAAGIADLLGLVDDNNEQTPTSSGNIPLGGTLTSLRQLLTVPGVTESLLFGEDRNQNGLLDSSEDDGDQSFPADNQNGRLDSGWSAHWTLTGSESNLRRSKKNTVRPKINLNQPNLARLYDQLLDFATPAEAKFVVAWRQSAPTYTDSTSGSNQPTAEEIMEERKRSVKDRIAMQMGLSENPFAKRQTQPASSVFTHQCINYFYKSAI